MGELGLSAGIARADPARLSTGERARIALLRLLARSPEVLLLDEPTANLDPESRERVIRRLHRYRNEHNAALVWVSHRPGETGAAEGVLVLPEGTLRRLGDDPAALRKHPR